MFDESKYGQHELSRDEKIQKIKELDDEWLRLDKAIDEEFNRIKVEHNIPDGGWESIDRSLMEKMYELEGQQTAVEEEQKKLKGEFQES